jgi:ComF family protein
MKEEKLSWKKKILFFFFPPQCAVCGKMGQEGLCPECRREVEENFEPKKYLAWGGNGFADEMLSLFPYDCRPVQTMLFDFKKNDYEDIASLFGEYIVRGAKSRLFYKNIDLVTFSPRRKSARRSAGFDQAESLAKIVARRLGLPYEPLLVRRGFSRAQHKMKGEDREKNVRGVFQPLRKLDGETVLLIDDIVTTGASARECARVLKKSGAMKVFVLSLAH